MIVIHRIEEHIKSSRSSREERGPLPVIVLRIQQEVSPNNCNTNSDNDQNYKHKEHEAVDIINLKTTKQRITHMAPLITQVEDNAFKILSKNLIIHVKNYIFMRVKSRVNSSSHFLRMATYIKLSEIY